MAGLYYSLTGEVPVALGHIGLGGMSLGLAIGGLVSRKWWLLSNILPFARSLNLLQTTQAQDGVLASGFSLITLAAVLSLVVLEIRRFRSRPMEDADSTGGSL